MQIITLYTHKRMGSDGGASVDFYESQEAADEGKEQWCEETQESIEDGTFTLELDVDADGKIILLKEPRSIYID